MTVDPATGDRRGVGWLAAVLVVHAALTVRHAWLTDDAYISFRYAHNLATGSGLRYNPDPVRAVEGFSNLAWVLLAAAFEGIGAFPGTWLSVLSCLCGSVVLVATYAVARRDLGVRPGPAVASVAGMAVSAPFVAWSTSGLEVMPQTLCFVGLSALVAFADGQAARAVAVGLAVALTALRVEGVLWALVAVGAGAVVRVREERALSRSVAGPAVGAGVAALAYEGFRLWWFGSAVPNTVLTKAVPLWIALERGVLYLVLFHAALLVPILAWAALAYVVRRHGPRGAWVAGLALSAPVWALTVGGDWMPHFRWLVPSLPFVALAAATALDALWARIGAWPTLALAAAAAAVGYLPLLDRTVIPEPALRVLDNTSVGPVRFVDGMFRPLASGRTQDRGWMAAALHALAAPGESVVVGPIGVIGYENPTLRIIDQCRLTSPWRPREKDVVGTRPGHDGCTSAAAFYRLKPDILYFTTVCGTRQRSSCERDPASAIERVVKRALRFDLEGLYYPAFVAVDVPESRSGTVYGVGLRRAGPVARDVGGDRYRADLEALRARRHPPATPWPAPSDDDP